MKFLAEGRRPFLNLIAISHTLAALTRIRFRASWICARAARDNCGSLFAHQRSVWVSRSRRIRGRLPSLGVPPPKEEQRTPARPEVPDESPVGARRAASLVLVRRPDYRRVQ